MVCIYSLPSYSSITGLRCSIPCINSVKKIVISWYRWQGKKKKDKKKGRKSKNNKKKKSTKDSESPKKETDAQRNKRLEKERKEKEAKEERERKKEKQEILGKGKRVGHPVWFCICTTQCISKPIIYF